MKARRAGPDARLIAALDCVDDVLLDLAPDGAIRAIAGAALQRGDHDCDALVGVTLRSLVHPADRVCFDAALRTVRLRGRATTTKLRIVAVDGTSLWMETTLTRGTAGSVTGVMRDVSRQMSRSDPCDIGDNVADVLIRTVSEYAIYLLDAGGNVRSWNRGAERIKGYTEAEIIGTNFALFFTDEDVAGGLPDALLDAARATGHVAGKGWRMRKDGSRFWAGIMIDAIRDRSGAIVGFSKVTRDISEERERIERERADAAQLADTIRLMTVAERLACVGRFRLDLQSGTLDWSDEVFRAAGIPPPHVPTPAQALALYHPDDRAAAAAVVARCIEQGEAYTHESRVVRADGTVRHVFVSGQAERGPDGRVTAVVGVMQDITAIKHSEAERQRLTERITIATESARVGIWEWDISADRKVWDPVMFALYGLDPGEAPPLYETWLALVDDRDRAHAKRALDDAIAGVRPYDTEFRIRWRNGEEHHIRAMGRVVFDAAGEPARMVGTNWDVSEIRQLSEALAREKDRAVYAAEHDALCGLLNRRGLEEWLAARADTAATILCLDLDGFKAVNDLGGHACGDAVLRAVARVIEGAIRTTDAAARIGGDEFVIVLDGAIDEREARDVTRRISTAVRALEPLGAHSSVRIDVSIGISTAADAAAIDGALRDADAELYRRKRERKRRSSDARTVRLPVEPSFSRR